MDTVLEAIANYLVRIVENTRGRIRCEIFLAFY